MNTDRGSDPGTFSQTLTFACDAGPVSFTITGATEAPPCRSDFNLDGVTDPDDLADFITAFFTGCT